MDDDVDICMISKGILEYLGYQADTALDGEDALAKFRRQLELGHPYAAVILDLTMAKGLGGADVLHEMQQLQPEVKAIVSSGYATEENAPRYQEMRFTAILAKPYRSSDMSRALREIIAPPS